MKLKKPPLKRQGKPFNAGQKFSKLVLNNYLLVPDVKLLFCPRN
jgi:hypothetical protein